jgi:hypothetical protein
MADLFAVGVTAGVPVLGTGTALTLTGLATNGVPILGSDLATKMMVTTSTATAGMGAAVVAISPNGLNANGQATMATSAPVAIASDQTPITFARTAKFQNVVSLATSTADIVVATASAGAFHDIYGLILANTSATATTFVLKDVTAGTTKAEFYLPAGDTRGFVMQSVDGIPSAATNTNWTGTLGTGGLTVVVTVLYVSKTS